MVHSIKERLFKYISPCDVASPFGPIKGYTKGTEAAQEGRNIKFMSVSLCKMEKQFVRSLGRLRVFM